MTGRNKADGLRSPWGWNRQFQQTLRPLKFSELNSVFQIPRKWIYRLYSYTINQIKISQPPFRATTTVSISCYSYEKDERAEPGKFHNNCPISPSHEIKVCPLSKTLFHHLLYCYVLYTSPLLGGLNEMLLRMPPKDLVLCKLCSCGCENVKCYAVRAW